MSITGDIITRFLLAAFLGGIIGAEREYRNKSAGFRTMIMISLGACFFTMLSSILGPNSTDRVASTIVTGIGFIGAGVIFKGEGRVNGITTASTIWAVSAIGMGVGAGQYAASILASIIILIVLSVLPFLEERIDDFNQIKTFTIDCIINEGILHHIRSLCKANHIKHKIVSIEKHLNEVSIMLWTRGNEKNMNALTSSFWNDSQINGFKVQGNSELFPSMPAKNNKT